MGREGEDSPSRRLRRRDPAGGGEGRAAEHRSTEHRVARNGTVDLVFTGELLAEETDAAAGKRRWTEIRIWHAETGQYVVQRIIRSTQPGENDRIMSSVLDRANQMKLALRFGKPYMTNLALDALTAAAELDPELAAASIERL